MLQLKQITCSPKVLRFVRSWIAFLFSSISIGDFPCRVLCGIRFFVQVAHQEALSHRPFGSPAAISAVRVIVIIVRLALSAIAFVSLCRGTVSFWIIPCCLSIRFSSWLWNSPPQSACTSATGHSLLVAFCSMWIISIRACPASFFFLKGLVIRQREKSSVTVRRYRNW